MNLAAGAVAGLTAVVAAQSLRRMAACVVAAAGLWALDTGRPDLSPAVFTVLLIVWLALEFGSAGRPFHRAVVVSELCGRSVPGLGLSATIIGGMLKAGDATTAAIGASAIAFGKGFGLASLAVLPWLGLWQCIVGAVLGIELALGQHQVAAVTFVVVIVVPIVFGRAALVLGHLGAIVAAVFCGAACLPFSAPPLVPACAAAIAAHLDAAIRGVRQRDSTRV